MSGPDSPLAALEALIFSGTGPVTPSAIKRVLGLSPGQITAALLEINNSLEKTGRPYEIVEIAGGYQFRTRPEYGELLSSAQPERKVKLSRASLDTLAVIAYRQPISRPEIEEIRSVDCGAVIKSLLERELVRVVGRRDAPGRPALYGTTSTFLEIFGLSSLRDLPDLRDLLSSSSVEATPIEEALGEEEAGASDADPERDASASEREGAALEGSSSSAAAASGIDAVEHELQETDETADALPPDPEASDSEASDAIERSNDGAGDTAATDADSASAAAATDAESSLEEDSRTAEPNTLLSPDEDVAAHASLERADEQTAEAEVLKPAGEGAAEPLEASLDLLATEGFAAAPPTDQIVQDEALGPETEADGNDQEGGADSRFDSSQHDSSVVPPTPTGVPEPGSDFESEPAQAGDVRERADVEPDADERLE